MAAPSPPAQPETHALRENPLPPARKRSLGWRRNTLALTATLGLPVFPALTFAAFVHADAIVGTVAIALSLLSLATAIRLREFYRTRLFDTLIVGFGAVYFSVLILWVALIFIHGDWRSLSVAGVNILFLIHYAGLVSRWREERQQR